MDLVPTVVFLVAALTLNVEAQNSVYIGEFRSLAHGVRSGPVYVLDDKTIHITDFHYDGEGPDAYFVIGVDNKFTEERPKGGLPFRQIVPDENGRHVQGTPRAAHAPRRIPMGRQAIRLGLDGIRFGPECSLVSCACSMSTDAGVGELGFNFPWTRPLYITRYEIKMSALIRYCQDGT